MLLRVSEEFKWSINKKKNDHRRHFVEMKTKKRKIKKIHKNKLSKEIRDLEICPCILRRSLII